MATTKVPSGHTGGTAPKSGIYAPKTGKGAEIALSEGDHMPPSLGQGVDYTLVRPTKPSKR